jgi:hypothetical protein
VNVLGLAGSMVLPVCRLSITSHRGMTARWPGARPEVSAERLKIVPRAAKLLAVENRRHACNGGGCPRRRGAPATHSAPLA